MPNRSIWPIDIKYHHSDLERSREWCHPALLEPHRQMVESHIQNTRLGGGITSLQRCSRSVRQPQSTGLNIKLYFVCFTFSSLNNLRRRKSQVLIFQHISQSTAAFLAYIFNCDNVTDEQDIRRRIETIQTTALLKSTRILRRVLEYCGK